MLVQVISEQAATTLNVRVVIQSSDAAGKALAQRIGFMPKTNFKWRKHESVVDRRHTPHRLHNTLNPVQEALALDLSKALLDSLDNLQTVAREFINANTSRSRIDRSKK